MKRSDSPEPSCASLKRDVSMDPLVHPLAQDGASSSAHRQTQMKRSDSPESSCVSMKSDQSMDRSITFKDGDPSSAHRQTQMKRSDSPESSCVSMKSDQSMDRSITFKDGDPSSAHSQIQAKRSDSPEPSCASMKSDVSVDPLVHFKDGASSSAHRSDPVSVGTEFQECFKLNLKKKFQCLNEVITNQENPTLLSEIYTELYITEGDSSEVSNEHEVRQIEAASRRTATEETPIKCNEIFKPFSEQDKHIRTVLTKGVAGIGKTVSVQKFILDWAEYKANQDVQFIFPLPFRELNLIKDKELSLLDLLHKYVKETKELEISMSHRALFIFDGLDECRLPLDFQSSVSLCDVTESASVDVLLTNLIKGNLLPSALIWITSRPAAADQIPSECVDRVTEVRGFTDPQKEEYFRKRISDQSLANRIISHLKASRSLYIMCHIPVFCWISSTVLERMLGKAKSGETPKTLTQMYTHFLIIQTKIKREKYTKNQKTDEDMLLKLAQLAFQQLMKGNLIFYEEDLRGCGIDVEEASVYSSVCTQIFREESGLLQSKVYCFVHLSIQEHLAALYVHLTCINQKRNVFKQSSFFKMNSFKKKKSVISDVHRSAVDQALQSKNGHLDLFLRFLLGLSLETNQTLLQGLVTQTGSSSHNREETVQYIKKKIRENLSAEKFLNLFHCLNELGDHSLVEEVQQYLQSGDLLTVNLSSSQWSAVVFVLLTSSEEMDVFDLSKYTKTYSRSDEVLIKLLPVVEASRRALFNHSILTEKNCEHLASVISSESSRLRELDLSWNELGDSGVKLLSVGLKNPLCKLKILKLWDCKITDYGCSALASALKSNPSHLRELDLTGNKLGDSGVKLLSTGLENPLCELETLTLHGCNISDEGCGALASALKSNPLHLRVLDLSVNNLRDSGVKLLSAGLKNPLCKLEILRLWDCKITDYGCSALASALKSNPSHLRELDLTGNKLGDSGVKLLSTGLENPLCELETLTLHGCNISDEGCGALASALKSNPLHLRVLDLSVNNLRDSGVKLLSAGLKNPLCKLEILRLLQCNITDDGCASLALALKSNPSHLGELDLFRNKLGNSGVKVLSDLKDNKHYQLQQLRF
ncbi:NACHT, LRR and PYD domains-containing protein 12-like [Colossoma macropomum]|uniref:NACHT, LRR and PYD domains-containing protein 12-like n=1 Tax=Colossoma macropomum TaxID=42526 RepID=UPI001864A694|nr:NACHT, LRR and PYD domains-containing protein 12-like [Colossoma macropomum]